MERLSSETNVPTDPVPRAGVFLVESRLSSLHPHMVESKEAESQFSLSFCKGTNAMVRAPSPDLVARQRPSTHELGAQIFNPRQREFAPVSMAVWMQLLRLNMHTALTQQVHFADHTHQKCLQVFRKSHANSSCGDLKKSGHCKLIC